MPKWDIPDALRERKAHLEKVASAAEDAYNAWWEWVPANDKPGEPPGEDLRYFMEQLGHTLLEAGFIVNEPIPQD